jgi:hypothetical protein
LGPMKELLWQHLPGRWRLRLRSPIAASVAFLSLDSWFGPSGASKTPLSHHRFSRRHTPPFPRSSPRGPKGRMNRGRSMVSLVHVSSYIDMHRYGHMYKALPSSRHSGGTVFGQLPLIDRARGRRVKGRLRSRECR